MCCNAGDSADRSIMRCLTSTGWLKRVSFAAMATLKLSCISYLASEMLPAPESFHHKKIPSLIIAAENKQLESD